MKSRFLSVPLARPAAVILSVALSFLAAAQDGGVTITKGAVRTIPISITGYSDDVRKILEFDLFVVGFEVNSGAAPQYRLAGSGQGEVRGALSDVNTQQVLFSRAYPGGSPRAQAHALANDVVKSLLQIPGIAGTKIAFRNLPGGRNVRGELVSEIWASDCDGANSVALTGDGSISFGPSWVPGQLKLFYTSFRGSRPEIYLQDLRSGNRTRVFSFPGTSSSPAVSPDGSKVVMVLSRGGSPDLWLANVDGSGLRQLTTTKELEASPAGPRMDARSVSPPPRGGVLPSTPCPPPAER